MKDERRAIARHDHDAVRLRRALRSALRSDDSEQVAQAIIACEEMGLWDIISTSLASPNWRQIASAAIFPIYYTHLGTAQPAWRQALIAVMRAASDIPTKTVALVALSGYPMPRPESVAHRRALMRDFTPPAEAVDWAIRCALFDPQREIALQAIAISVATDRWHILSWALRHETRYSDAIISTALQDHLVKTRRSIGLLPYALWSRRAEDRGTAIELVCRHRIDAYRAEAIAALGDPVPIVRMRAAYAMRDLGADPDVTDALLTLLDDPDYDVSTAARNTLIQIGHADLVMLARMFGR